MIYIYIYVYIAVPRYGYVSIEPWGHASAIRNEINECPDRTMETTTIITTGKTNKVPTIVNTRRFLRSVLVDEDLGRSHKSAE